MRMQPQALYGFQRAAKLLAVPNNDVYSCALAVRTFTTFIARPKPIRILGLESSADDTCAAIVDADRKIHANIVIKQDDLLEKYGGIHPYHATSRHQHNMGKALRRCLDEAELEVGDVDAIAYTRGPGMASCLATCTLAAKTLAAAHKKPLIGVHHMQAHALTVGLTEEEPPVYPFLSLLVSGGHTMLLYVSGPFDFKLLANTDDDAIGDAFDKVARWLDIPLGDLSGGAALESFIASRSATHEVVLPSTAAGKMIFSFSGLKSAVKREIDRLQGNAIEQRHAIASAFQSAAVGQLEARIGQSIRVFPEHQPSSLVVSGGVASNMYLRAQLRTCLDGYNQRQMRLLFPPVNLCTDNAVMIAWAGLERHKRQMWDDFDSPIRAKWPLEECASMV